MNFKKILVTILACTTILSLSACSDRGTPDKENSDSSVSESSQVSDDSSKNDESSSDSKSETSDTTSNSESTSQSSDTTTSETSESSSEETKPTIVKDGKTAKEKLDQAIKINTDSVGWITIPNTNIDDEILQTTDNEYYLRRDITRKNNWYGCYFADKANVLKTSVELSPNTVIYGHNMEDRPNGKKFAQLFKYLDVEFAKNNPYIYVTTKDENLVFQVFAVYYNNSAELPHHVCDPAKEARNFTMAQMIEGAKERSQLIYDVDVNENDKILTLSTCTYKYGGEANTEQKFVVQARLLRKGEAEQKTVSVTKNPSPLEPTFSKNYTK